MGAKGWLETYLPGETQEGDWFHNMKQMIRTSADLAEQAAHKARIKLNEAKGIYKEDDGVQGRSKVPCKWLVTAGVCRNGDLCDFSHDPEMLQARPLEKKRAVECVYFQKGQCIRGE